MNSIYHEKSAYDFVCWLTC